MESGSSGRTTDSGWAAFAGVIMFIVGSLDALWGLGAVLNNNIVVVGGQGAIVADITTWGWVHLILGSAVALTGVGLSPATPLLDGSGSSSSRSTRSFRSSGSPRRRCGPF